MNSWNVIQKKQLKKELGFIAAIVICTIIGIILDLAKRPINICKCDNWSSLCLSILTIQGTVTTLVITVISLMSSKIERAYLGVSVNDFLMEVKPIFFKQNQIIKSDLILLPVGVVLYIVNAYWTLLLFFAISLILVQVSVNEVYEVFLGTEKIDEEIKAYLLDGTEEKSKPIMKKSVNQKMIDLTDQWEKEITTQPEYLYNDYCKVFDKIFDSSFDDKDCRKRLQDQCEKIVLALLSIGTDNLTIRAANFLNNCYECINNYLLKTKHDNEIIKFHLFHNVCEEFRTEFSGIKLSKMLRRFNWTGFVKTVIFDSVSLEKAENPFKCLDIWSINELFYTMGNIYAITEKGGVGLFHKGII